MYRVGQSQQVTRKIDTHPVRVSAVRLPGLVAFDKNQYLLRRKNPFHLICLSVPARTDHGMELFGLLGRIKVLCTSWDTFHEASLKTQENEPEVRSNWTFGGVREPACAYPRCITRKMLPLASEPCPAQSPSGQSDSCEQPTPPKTHPHRYSPYDVTSAVVITAELGDAH